MRTSCPVHWVVTLSRTVLPGRFPFLPGPLPFPALHPARQWSERTEMAFTQQRQSKSYIHRFLLYHLCILFIIYQRPSLSGPGGRRPPNMWRTPSRPLRVGVRRWLEECVSVGLCAGRLPPTVRPGHPGGGHFSQDDYHHSLTYIL